MIIDSHAHYAHFSFDKEAPRLCAENGGYSSLRLAREELLAKMREKGIVGVIEPSIEFENIEKQLALATKYDGFFKIAVGIHPTRCIRTDWEKREQLESYAANECVIAIGETGLDYHYKRKMQQRELQKAWADQLPPCCRFGRSKVPRKCFGFAGRLPAPSPALPPAATRRLQSPSARSAFLCCRIRLW